jgi:hypothetical protein
MYIASYQRMCTNSFDKAAAGYYNSATFDGAEVELRPRYMGFANLKNESSSLTPYFSSFPNMTIDSDNNGEIDYIPLGVHPFLSTMSNGYSPIHDSRPYYSVKCYDQAFDLKSQIRIHIRDWDREFTLNHVYMNAVSDIEAPGDRLIDNNGIYDDDQPWNDRYDWDDTWSIIGAYTNDNCRDIKEHPAKGACMGWSGGSWVAYPVAQNKEDCIAAFDAVTIHKCRDEVSTTRTSCIDNAGMSIFWKESNWESDDNSSNNFPGGI